MIVKTRPSCRRIEHIGGEHPHATSHHSTGRVQVHLPRHGLRAGAQPSSLRPSHCALPRPTARTSRLWRKSLLAQAAAGGRSSLMASMNGLRSCSKTRLRRLVVWCLVVLLLLGQVERATGPRRCLGPRNVLFARRPVRRVDRSEGTEPGSGHRKRTIRGTRARKRWLAP